MTNTTEISQSESLAAGPKVAIETKNLRKSFGKLEVLKGISTKIHQGEVVAVIGPSGCGKSTFLRCINQLEKPIGEVFIHGKCISHMNTSQVSVACKMGMVFQLFHLFPHLTVLENLTFAPLNILKKSPADAEAKAQALLERVGLQDKAHVYPAKLSGGQKQRVAIARALAMDPEILLFDEPTSALDPEMVSEVLEVIQGLAHTGITMAVVTHEMGFARQVADRILFMHEGLIAVDAPPDVFFSQPGHERAVRFLEKMLSH